MKHVGPWMRGAGWRASRSPDMYPVDMRLEAVTEETGFRHTRPDPWIQQVYGQRPASNIGQWLGPWAPGGRLQ